MKYFLFSIFISLLIKPVFGKQGTVKEIQNINKSKYSEVCTNYKLQRDIDKKRKLKIEREFRKLEYTFENPFVSLNPLKRAPLSGIIKFKTNKKYKVTIDLVKNNGKLESVNKSNIYTNNHDYIIKWLYPDHKNEIRISALSIDGSKRKNTIYVKTNKLNKNIPVAVRQKNNRYYNNYISTKYLLSFVENNKTAIVDSKGNYRWIIHPLPMSHTVLRDRDHFFISHMGTNCLIKINFLGEITNIYDMNKYYFHHDFTFIKNNLIILVTKLNLNSVQDHIIEYDTTNNRIIKEWDLRKYFNVIPLKKKKKLKFWKEPVNDWLHANSITFIEDDKTLLISSRYQGIFKIGYDGDFKWIISKNKNFIKDNLKNRFMKYNSNTKFDENNTKYQVNNLLWPDGQHSAIMINENQLFYFNNNGGNPKNRKKAISSGIIYKINEKTKFFELLSHLGTDEQIFSYFISSVDFNFMNQNKILMYGNVDDAYNKKISKLIEYDDNNLKINEIDFIGDNIFSSKYYY